jgi:hypothetical protein
MDGTRVLHSCDHNIGGCVKLEHPYQYDGLRIVVIKLATRDHRSRAKHFCFHCGKLCLVRDFDLYSSTNICGASNQSLRIIKRGLDLDGLTPGLLRLRVKYWCPIIDR